MIRRGPLVNVQTAIVILAAAAAAVYLARTAWRTWAGSGCDKGCGCGPKSEAGPKLIAADELLVRMRSGKGSGPRERPVSDGGGNSGDFSA
jgi:hypothetical protein